MTTVTWVILLIALIAIAAAVYFAWRAQRTKQLRTKFGPEYDRLVHESGSAARAEKELDYREKRVEKFHIRPLSREECDRFAGEWRAAQEHFVDDPRAAIAEADELVHRAMKARGYPIAGGFTERAADISVEHPRVVEHYRAAHDIAVRDSKNPVSTEDLRVAMRHYRALFEDLLDRRVTDFEEVKK
jgi:hypothetical protein